jgi:hypothetical protein
MIVWGLLGVGICLMIGRRPCAAFGNLAGDGTRYSARRPTTGRDWRCSLHDDAEREYACGPARGLPDTQVGAFAQALYGGEKKTAGR